RGAGGTRRGRVAATWGAPGRGSIHRQVRGAGPAALAAVRPGDHGVVAGAAAVLRRAEAAADLGVLAARPSHLPPPYAGADLAAAGWPRTGPAHLRAIRRCDLGPGRPYLLEGGCRARGLRESTPG